MNAKEKQIEIISLYLKPTLKSYGYKTSGQNWWKDKGDFFYFINLQNYSFNSKDAVYFCFNIGVLIKATMKDSTQKKPNYFDPGIKLRENSYLTNERLKQEFRNESGYVIDNKTDVANFIIEMHNDFENEILPSLEKLNSLEDCLARYENVVLLGEYFKKTLIENQLV